MTEINWTDVDGAQGHVTTDPYVLGNAVAVAALNVWADDGDGIFITRDQARAIIGLLQGVLDVTTDVRADDDEDGMPQWMTPDDLNYRGGGVMGRRRKRDTDARADTDYPPPTDGPCPTCGGWGVIHTDRPGATSPRPCPACTTDARADATREET